MENNKNPDEIIIQFKPKIEKKRRIWLCGLSQPGTLEDIKETVGPIWDSPSIDGLCFCHHNITGDDDVADWLEEHKRDGEITYNRFVGRYDYSRNHILYQTKVDINDWCLIKDTLEFIEPDFLNVKLPEMIDFFDNNFIDSIYICGKIFAFKYTEDVFYLGGVHEQAKGLSKGVELTRIPSFEDNTKYFKNLRPLKRDKQHFIKHFFTYFVSSGGQNQALDGLFHNYPNNPKLLQEKFIERETLRRDFKDYVRNVLKITLKYEDFAQYLKDNKDNLSDKMKEYLNKEKILNDVYRKIVLNDNDFIHSHLLSEMVKVP